MAEEYTVGLTVTGQGDVDAALASIERLDDGLDNVADAAESASGSFSKAEKDAKRIARQFDAADRAVYDLAGHYGDLSTIFNTSEVPLGRTIGRYYELKEAFVKLGLYTSKGKALLAATALGLSTLAVLAAVATAAIVAAGAALVGIAIKMADAANKANTLREAMTGSAASAAALTSTINRVSSKVPISSAKVAELADNLWKAGKRGTELEKSLLEASYEASNLGKNPDPALLAKRMGQLDVIGTKLGDNIAKIFKGPRTTEATTRFGMALSGLTERFGENHAEGRALQTLLGTIVTPLIDGLTALMPLAIQVFRGMIIVALDVAIAAAKVRNAIIEMIPDWVKEKFNELTANVDAFAFAAEIGKVALGFLAAAFIVLAVAVGIVLVSLLLVPAILVGIAIAATLLAGKISGAVKSAIAALGEFASSGHEAAKNMIDGLVNGIRSGVGVVVSAVKAMAQSAVGAIKSALKIASPSKVFEGLGEFTGEGFVAGIEGQTTEVNTALETMVAPPSLESPVAAAQMAQGGVMGGGTGIDMTGATFVFNGVKDAEAAVSGFEEALTRILEGDAVQVGAG